jgi:hypothetical protein
MRFYVTFAQDNVTCSRCGVTEPAGITGLGMWCYSVDDVRRSVRDKIPDVPVGWSMNGRSDLRCSSCTK